MATPTTLPATAVAGEVLTASYVNALRGAFRVLQVVSGQTSTSASNATNTFADTNLTATITPSSASSKVLVMVVQNGVYKSAGNIQNRITIGLFRGATEIYTVSDILFTGTLLDLHGPTISILSLDSPATTSATTYKTQFRNPGAAATVSVQVNNLSSSSIILAEISA
jgi:hypothetical protein